MACVQTTSLLERDCPACRQEENGRSAVIDTCAKPMLPSSNRTPRDIQRVGMSRMPIHLRAERQISRYLSRCGNGRLRKWNVSEGKRKPCSKPIRVKGEIVGPMSRRIHLSSMVFIGWLMMIIAFMLLRQTFSLELFFVLAMIGFLVIVALIHTTTVQPRYLRRMKYMAAVSFLVFGYIIANRIVAILVR